MERTRVWRWLSVLLTFVVATDLSAVQLVYDHFNDGTLDCRWQVTFEDALGWTFAEAGTHLTVTDIVPRVVNHASGGTYAVVRLRREVPLVGDFDAAMRLSWESEGGLRPTQKLYLELHGLDNGCVALGGYQDDWGTARGAKRAIAGGNSYSSGSNTLPYAGQCTIAITRVGGLITVNWDGQTLLTANWTAPVRYADIVFYYYAYEGSYTSFFASESVDWVSFSGTPLTAPVCTSSNAGAALAIGGSVDEQRAAINAGPPAFVPSAWTEVQRHADMHQAASFACGDPGVPDPLAMPYVDAGSYLSGVDEVTLDNCSSAWYRWAFEMPARFRNASFHGVANVDDVAVAYLNGRRISAQLLADDAFGTDRTDGDGRRLLAGPTPDPLDTPCGDTTYLVPGTNEIIVGVLRAGASPTGLEFEGSVFYDVWADSDGDGDVDLTDFTAFQACFNGPNRAPAQPTCGGLDSDLDADVDLTDFGTFQGCFNGPNRPPGC